MAPSVLDFLLQGTDRGVQGLHRRGVVGVGAHHVGAFQALLVEQPAQVLLRRVQRDLPLPFFEIKPKHCSPEMRPSVVYYLNDASLTRLLECHQLVVVEVRKALAPSGPEQDQQ